MDCPNQCKAEWRKEDEHEVDVEHEEDAVPYAPRAVPAGHTHGPWWLSSKSNPFKEGQGIPLASLCLVLLALLAGVGQLIQHPTLRRWRATTFGRDPAAGKLPVAPAEVNVTPADDLGRSEGSTIRGAREAGAQPADLGGSSSSRSAPHSFDAGASLALPTALVETPGAEGAIPGGDSALSGVDGAGQPPVCRRRTDCALAVRRLMERTGLQRLNETERERLGAPCSHTWTGTVLGYYSGHSGLTDVRPLLDFTTGVRRMCRELQGMAESLREDLGCIEGTSSEGLNRTSTQRDSSLAQRDASLAQKPGSLAPPGSALGGTAQRKGFTPLPNEAEVSGRVKDGGPHSGGRIEEEDEAGTETDAWADHNWGSCWPDGRPWSSGVKASDLPTAKFLVAAMNVEQLSKAKMHLSEAARLARRTGRILVVPPASASRLGAGRQLAACNYLSLNSLAAKEVPVADHPGSDETRMVEGGAEWISSDVFQYFLGSYLPRTPKVSFLCFESLGMWPCIEKDDVVNAMEYILGMSYGATPDGNNNTVHFYMQAASGAACRSLTNPQDPLDIINHRMAESDIVVLLKITPAMLNFMDPDPETHGDVVLPYAAPFQTRAERIVALLGEPYVAMHVRSEFIVWNKMQEHQENTMGEQIMRCAQNALALAKSKAEEIGAKHVFIAADVPSNLSSGAFRSESWTWLVSVYGMENTLIPAAEALEVLREGIPNSISIEELDPTALSLDPGMLSIIDKLVLSSAHVFIAGDDDCGGGHAFEADILRRRSHLHKEPKVIRWRAMKPYEAWTRPILEVIRFLFNMN